MPSQCFKRQFCSACQHFPRSGPSRLRPSILATSTSQVGKSNTRLSKTPVSIRLLHPRLASTSTSSSQSTSSSAAASARQQHQQAYYAKRNRSLLLYTTAVLVLGVGVTYAAVPLYRIFCSATGYGGTPMTSGGNVDADGKVYGLGRFAAEKLIPFYGDPLKGQKDKKIRVSFNADCSDALPWKFTPLQKSVVVRPGESALAFYTAKNKSDKDIIGIATYNVTPNNIAPYFAKVECFCFEEQRLLAGEEVDLPILFFIDRDFADDPTMRDIDDVVLSYTFFRAKRDSYGNLVPDNSSS